MATAKRSSPNRRKSAATGSRTASSPAPASSTTKKRTQAAKKPAAASPSPKKAGASGATTTGARNGSARRTSGSQNGSSRRQASSRARTSSQSRTAQSPDGVVGSVKHAGASALRAANRASGPTITVAAAVAGIAGGLMLRQRPKPAMRDGLGARSRELLRDIDPSAVMEGLGRASMLVSQRSKSLARDIDHVADRAERLGKVLR